MAVSVGATGTERTTLVDTTFSGGSAVITTVAGDTALLVGVCDTVSEVGALQLSWNGVALTQIGTAVVDGSGAAIYLFGLVNPAIGAQALAITGVTGTTFVDAISFKGTKTTFGTCFINNATNTGTGTTASVSVTSATGDMVAAIHLNRSAGISAVNQTQWFIGGDASWAGNRAAGAASVSLTATLLLSTGWGSLGINIAASPDGPLGQDEWPVPRRRRQLLQDFQQSSAIELFTYIPNQPRSPVLWRRKPLVDESAAQSTLLGTPQTLFPVITPAPFNETDWPNPSRGPRRNPQDWSDSFKLPLQQVIQPNQYDWPNPRGPRRGVQDWSDSFKLPLQQDIQPNQYNWPVPKAPRRGVQDWIASTNIALLTSVAGTPFVQTDWPNPRGSRSNILLGWTDKLIVDILPPPANYDQPNPRIAKRNPQDWILPIPAPLTVAPAATPPNNQTDWPNPRAARRNLQDWQDSFNLPLQQTLPPRQLDWPNPRGKVPNLWRGWLSPLNVTLVVTPPQQPFRNYDWPNPRGKRQPVITVRYFVRGLTPPIGPVYNPDLTLKNEVRRIRYLTNIGGQIRYLKNEIRS